MNSIINEGRKLSFCSLDIALQELNNTHTSEIKLRDEWLLNLSRESTVISEGWYTPPPHGAVILAATKKDQFDRVNFLSLRDKEFWSNENPIDWNESVLYCYSSPVSTQTGVIADFSTSIYLGSNIDIKNHFKNCYEASCDCLKILKNNTETVSFFLQVVGIFAEYELEIFGFSTTDEATINLGHSFPKLRYSDISGKTKLTEAQRKYISNSRKFINQSLSWDLRGVNSFSFEPRLRSVNNSELPQVSLHFLVSIIDDKVLIQHDCDKWWQQY